MSYRNHAKKIESMIDHEDDTFEFNEDMNNASNARLIIEKA